MKSSETRACAEAVDAIAIALTRVIACFMGEGSSVLD